MMHYGSEYGGMMGGFGGGFWWHWGFQLLILVLFFLVIWWLLKGGIGEEPAKILKRRLASGEISEKEYYKLKKEIE
jgi:uncharacterized membrane protein